MKKAAILSLFGGILHIADFIFFGIHSMKQELFYDFVWSFCSYTSSTSFVNILPLNVIYTVHYISSMSLLQYSVNL